jgi:hypothetical protein
MTTPEPQLPEGPLRRLFGAVRHGDAAAFVELFGNTGAVDDWGRVFAGGDRVAFWNDSEFIGLHVQLTVNHITVQAQPVIGVSITTDGGYTGPATLTFTLAEDGDHIHLMHMAD